MAEEDGHPLLQAATAAAARLLARPPSRAALLARPELAARLAELQRSGCRQLSRAAAAALEAAATAGADWAVIVQRLRFEAHNREWLQVAAQPHSWPGATKLPAQRATLPVLAAEQRIRAFWGGSLLPAA